MLEARWELIAISDTEIELSRDWPVSEPVTKKEDTSS
jgi:hypothetical protein